MKILHTVESYLPEKHGMSEVVRQISELLHLSGHDVTVATSISPFRKLHQINGVKIKSFDIKGNRVTGMSGEIEKYQSFLQQDKFDIITNFAAQQWASDLCFDLLPSLKAKKVFVPTGFSGLKNPIYSGYFEQMKTWMKHYDMNVFLSNNYQDVIFARDNNINRRILIPNGASRKEFLEKRDFDIRNFLNIPQKRRIVLHVGSYTGLKGHDQALKIFLKSKLKNAVLLFVGENFERPEVSNFIQKINWLKGGFKFSRFNKNGLINLTHFIINLFSGKLFNVLLVKLDRRELIAAYQQADLLLFPSMIECSPVVLFEALASNTPFLVTRVGNSEEIIEWTNGGVLLPTLSATDGYSYAILSESATIISELLEDSGRLEELKVQGYSSWIENFTWEKIGQQYEKMYLDLLKQK